LQERARAAEAARSAEAEAARRQAQPPTVPESPMLSYKLRPPRAQRADPAPAEPPPPPLFKAKPVDPRVLHSCGERGVPMVPSAAVTQPVGFQLRTDARGVSWAFSLWDRSILTGIYRCHACSDHEILFHFGIGPF
jgi:hypothetical protein